MHSDQLAEHLAAYVERTSRPEQDRELAQALRGAPSVCREAARSLFVDCVARQLAATPIDARKVTQMLPRARGDALVTGVMRELKDGVGTGRPRGGTVRRFPVLARRPVRIWWLTAAAAAVLAVFGWALVRQWDVLGPGAGPRSAARVASVAGRCMRVVDGRSSALGVGDTVRIGEELACEGPGAALVVQLADGTSLSLRERGRMRLEAPGQKARRGVSLTQGLLAAQVPPRDADRALWVRSPHAIVTVIGTRFTVRAGAGSTRTAVQSGRVRVANLVTGEQFDLAAGYDAVTGADTVITATNQASRARRAGLVALYTFDEGRGRLVYDVSGVAPPLNLLIRDGSSSAWRPGGGLSLSAPGLIASPKPAIKIVRACQRSRAFSVEAWVAPATSTQGLTLTDETGREIAVGPARIVTLSRGARGWAFTLGQNGGVYSFRHLPRLDIMSGVTFESTPGTVAPRLTHVVFTRDAQGVCRCYVDGRNVTALASGGGPAPGRMVSAPGDLAGWDESYRLGLADELDLPAGDTRAWLGTYRRVAIYSRALDAGEVADTYRTGLPGLRQARLHWE